MAAATNFRPWLRTAPKPNARIRLFCFPYSGAGTSVFHTWHKSFPDDIQICPVELPGRETRYNEAPIDDLSLIVRELASSIDCFLDRPYALFGHSSGALVAYELARELRRRNKPIPVRFFASACRAPQLPLQRSPIHQLDDKEFLEQLTQYAGIPDGPAGNLELTLSVLPALRADFKMFETYRFVPEAPLTTPITALGGTEDHLVRRGDLVAWHTQTTSGFNLCLIAGGHFFIRSAAERVIEATTQGLR